jgi:hypothetical protein
MVARHRGQLPFTHQNALPSVMISLGEVALADVDDCIAGVRPRPVEPLHHPPPDCKSPRRA